MERLGDSLRHAVHPDRHAQIPPLVERLQTLLSGEPPTDAALSRLAEAFAECAGGDPQTLAAIQRALVDCLSSNEPIRSELLVAITEAFSHLGTDGPRSSSNHGVSADYRSPRLFDRHWEGAFLQQIIDTVGDPIFVKDEQHRWIFLNDAYCNFMGYPRNKLLGKSDFDFFPEHEAEVFWEKDKMVFCTGEPVENEESFTDGSGKEHVIITKKTMFVDSKQRKFLVGVIRDITKRKQLEARLAMAKRLMSLGTLAGGVAHEINNPLTFVLANLDYLIESLGTEEACNEEQKVALQTAFRGAQRVSDIVQDLKTFSDPTETLAPVDLRESLRSTVELTANDISRRAQLIEAYDPVPHIEGNPRALDQIFLNLLLNAVQAIDEGNPDANEIRVRCRTSADGEAIIEISDSGRGIEKTDIPHIFDPFFSTKPVGEGTGLGLAISHTLVEALNGQIDVESAPNAGTTFRLIFPPVDT